MNSMKIILTVVVGLLVSAVQAEEMCLIAMHAKTGDIVAKKGTTCDTRVPPMCSFNIALSLMGYESQVLEDETHPEWSYTPRPDGRPVDEKDQVPQTPKTWMAKSIVWYSQKLASQIGLKQFSTFIEQFDYGNNDISGDKAKKNGLTNSWLNSSLKISPHEQLTFLRKVVNRTLLLSPHTYDMTQNILLIEELKNGWKYYGKTGTGTELNNAQGMKNIDKKFGWLVGWVQKDEQAYVFAYHFKDVETAPSGDERYNTVLEFFKESGLLSGDLT